MVAYLFVCNCLDPCEVGVILPKTILIVEDHPIYQQGLSQFLAEEFPYSQSVQVSTGGEAMAKFRSQAWSLIILDLSLPDRSGLDVLKEMKENQPTIPVVVLTLHSEDRYAVRAFRAGADGYVTKDSSPRLFGEAIRKVINGGKYVSASMAEKLAVNLFRRDDHPPHDALSDREFQVLGLLAQGKTASAIATELHLSINTVSTYRARLLEKLNLQSTAELIAYAVQNRLID
jgi:two-component system, NarL family, invasion response regulator UvrY